MSPRLGPVGGRIVRAEGPERRPSLRTAAAAGTPAPSGPPSFQDFLDLSVRLTGFSRFDLEGTGVAEPYFETLRRVVGDTFLAGFLAVFRSIADDGPRDVDAAIERRIMKDTDLGPVARNVVLMWYLGNWYQLPPGWRNRNGASPADVTSVVSPQAYVEGLVWPAIEAHPMGAKQPGFASWSVPPGKWGRSL